MRACSSSISSGIATRGARSPTVCFVSFWTASRSLSLVSKQYLLALFTGELIDLFNLGERLVGTFFRSCLTRCLFSLGSEYHCSDAPTGVGTGSPSEIVGMFFIWLGIIPGALLRVFCLCTLGVCRMSSGCVGFVNVCGCWFYGCSGK